MTNWEAIGAISRVVAAIGVIISLCYVAVQMRQSNRLAKRAGVQKLTEGRIEFNRLLAEDPELNDLFWKGLETPDDLAESDWQRWRMVFSCLARQYESIHFDEIEGLLPHNFIKAQKASMQRWLTRPGAVRFFKELGDDFDPSFIRDVVESNCK